MFSRAIRSATAAAARVKVAADRAARAAPERLVKGVTTAVAFGSPLLMAGLWPVSSSAPAASKTVASAAAPGTACTPVSVGSGPYTSAEKPTGKLDCDGLPIVGMDLAFAPNVQPPIKRRHPVHYTVSMNSDRRVLPIDSTRKYEFWTFNGSVPGPFLRTRVGDKLTVNFKNLDSTGMQHNIDFHAVSGPGGGAAVLTADTGATKEATFKMVFPGLYIYHCAVHPVGVHEANGMYGLLLVEPAEGLPTVDKEWYVVQSEFYTDDDPVDKDNVLGLNYERGQNEEPTYVVFNGRVGSMTDDSNKLQATTTDRVRLFFGNGGPNLVSSFHVIGAVFDKVYREGDLMTPPARGIQTTLVPAGGSTVVEFETPVPGNYTLVDHSIWRIDKGAVGFISAKGDARPDLYHSHAPPKNCPSCLTHPPV